MTKKSIQTFAAGMIVATGILAIVFFITGKGEAEANTTDEAKTAMVTQADVKSYLDSKKEVSLNRDAYQELLDYKEKALKASEIDSTKNDDSKQDTQKTKAKTKSLKIVIKNGMSTSDVSDMLEKEGIINSSKDFNDYVIDAGYHKEIRAGSFKLKTGMTFKQIVKSLTK
ncbi:endolytic transglycosylase MltG [Bacillus sp. NPDC077027]|uniref:endolytic transglycosylase MltG n=1 Tax=Bacillus sp. NPDC077027 TaxID=3390548 RepID=UPI003D07B114